MASKCHLLFRLPPFYHKNHRFSKWSLEYVRDLSISTLQLYDNYVPHVNEVVEFIGIYALCTDTYGLEEDRMLHRLFSDRIEMSSIKSKIPEVHVLACLSQSPYYPYTIRSAINASFSMFPPFWHNIRLSFTVCLWKHSTDPNATIREHPTPS